MCVNNLSKVALGSAAAGVEPAISSRKSDALTTTTPSHTKQTALAVETF